MTNYYNQIKTFVSNVMMVLRHCFWMIKKNVTEFHNHYLNVYNLIEWLPMLM